MGTRDKRFLQANFWRARRRPEGGGATALARIFGRPEGARREVERRRLPDKDHPRRMREKRFLKENAWSA
eukprot:12402613-Karenia_brevis.AAC.1